MTMLDMVALATAIALGVILGRWSFGKVKSRKRSGASTGESGKSDEELKELDQLKSEFVSIVSHQLRSPLTVIKGYISMALEGAFGPLTEELRERLSRIYKTNERLIRLVGDLINLGRIERGSIEYNFTPVSITKLLTDLVEDLNLAAREQGLKITASVSPDLPLLRGDEEKLHQIFANIIDNAIRYTPAGSINVRAELSEDKKNILIAIRDTGMGIDAGDKPHIFRQFIRGSGASRAHTEGTGLGLYVAKRIVEDHGGRIWAESPGKGKGSTFFVELPLNS